MCRINASVSASSSVGWYYQFARPRPNSSHWRRRLSCGCSGTIHCRLASTEPGSFFYPVQLHLQAADFLVQFCLNSFVLLVALGTRRAKEFSGSPLHLTFPLTDLRRMHLILSGSLIDGLQPLQGLKSHPALKSALCRMRFFPIVPPHSDHGSILLNSWSEFWGPLYFGPTPKASI